VFNSSTVEHVADEHGEIQWARELRDDRIRELRAGGWSMREIAAEVGCSVGTVHYVINS
jgi:DNA-binding NarL/FixJ family response regulator